MQALYAYELSPLPFPELVQQYLNDFRTSERDSEFAKSLLRRTLDHKEEFDAIVVSKVQHWELKRIALIDKILLRIGLCELLYFDDIPPKVTINEMIEVGKKFSTEESGKFINGVLDAILSDLKSNKLLHKQGRGLVEATQKQTTTEVK